MEGGRTAGRGGREHDLSWADRDSATHGERHDLEAADVDEAAVGDLELGDDREREEADRVERLFE